MATILQRFNKLGIAHSNPVLQLVGVHVANVLSRYVDCIPHKVLQEEEDKIYLVNNYPEKYTERIDFEILYWVNHTPEKWERKSRTEWWRHYKQLPK